MTEPQAAVGTTSAVTDEPQTPSSPRVLETSTSNVEMSELQADPPNATPAVEHNPNVTPSAVPSLPTEPSPPPQPHATASTPAESTTAQAAGAGAPSLPTAESSVSGVEAIDPSTTTATTTHPELAPAASAGPSIHITLLLTTGARHPYKIDRKYLRKRDVEVEGDDPFNISVYTLKELIWRDWRSEWESRPSSPAYIRLINMGRMLDDKVPLKDCRFNHESPNIVHMTVKPQEILHDDDDNAKSGKIGRYRDDGEEPTAGCRCVIL